MKESHGEGLAPHTGSESCVGRRKAAGEALTGVHAGQPLSSEINPIGVPTLLIGAEGNIGHGAIARAMLGPRGVEDPVHAWKLFAREPGDPVSAHDRWSGGPVGESPKAYTSDMYAAGKSDGPIVPTKRPNNDGPETKLRSKKDRALLL